MENRPILLEYSMICHILFSATGTETNGVFCKVKVGISIHYILTTISDAQPPIILQTDNQVAESFTNNIINQQKLKCWVIKLHWICNKENRSHFIIKWIKG